MPEEEIDEIEQWSPVARERFEAAAQAFEQALRDHTQMLLTMTGRRSETPQIFEAGDRLAQAAATYADAQFDFTGTFPPLGLAQTDEDDEEDYDESDEDTVEPVGKISVLYRADYRVTDEAAVVEAGRVAYRELWPEDTEQDAQDDVTNIGRALYQIQHKDDLSKLHEVQGLEPAGTTTWVIEAIELMDEQNIDNVEGVDTSESPFTLPSSDQRQVLHRLTELWS